MKRPAAAVFGVLVSTTVLAQGSRAAQSLWRTPERGSEERAQIMAALPTKLMEFDPNAGRLMFVVKALCLNAHVGWMSVEPQSRDGQTKLEPLQATLKHSQSAWVVDQLACAETECERGTDAAALRARIKTQCALH